MAENSAMQSAQRRVTPVHLELAADGNQFMDRRRSMLELFNEEECGRQTRIRKIRCDQNNPNARTPPIREISIRTSAPLFK